MSDAAAARAFAVLERAIACAPIPGAAAAVDDDIACFGVLEPGGSPVTSDTWYDLASLTKVLVTVPLCLEAIASGTLDPRAPLRDVLQEVAWLQASPNLGDTTVLQLATHTSGLKAWEPLYTLGLDRQTHFARLLHSQPGAQASMEYSDLGYMILGHLLERLCNARLDELARKMFERIGLDRELRFGPLERGEVAPTEHCPWRQRLLRGEVHDENAAALGGVAGHAGLFGTLNGVRGYARALLDHTLHSSAVVDYLSREHARATPPDEERRGFGWILAHPGWSGGDLTSDRAIGHTGFTGTGLWIDLARQRYTVLLTNRVYPSRHVDSGIIQLRRAFNHAAFA